ncbi:MAG: hypothetical protein R2771_10525 [Saprospiraceae bacterium]
MSHSRLLMGGVIIVLHLTKFDKNIKDISNSDLFTNYNVKTTSKTEISGFYDKIKNDKTFSSVDYFDQSNTIVLSIDSSKLNSTETISIVANKLEHDLTEYHIISKPKDVSSLKEKKK